MPQDSKLANLRDKLQGQLTALENTLETVEASVYEAIIRYVIQYHAHPEKCTLREMERELGIPYTRLKRFVETLSEEGVLVAMEMGTIRPYVINDLDRALQKGYIDPSFEDLMAWTDLPFNETPGSHSVVAREWLTVLLSNFPRWLVPITHNSDSPLSECELTLALATLNLPDVPEDHKGKLLEALEDADQKYRDGSPGGQPLITDDVRQRAEAAVPELEGLEDFVRGLGFIKLHVVPYVYSVAAPRWMDRQAIFWPRGVWAREIWFELGCPETVTPEEAQAAARRLAEKQVRYLLAVSRWLVSLLESIGVDGTVEFFNKPQHVFADGETGWVDVPSRYTKSHLLYQVIPLTYGALVNLGMGGDPDLTRKAKQYGKMIRVAVERGYRGKAAERSGLADWSQT
ncbi:MAG: hypothetical protein ACYC6V_01340 [Bacillota bacterium]